MAIAAIAAAIDDIDLAKVRLDDRRDEFAATLRHEVDTTLAGGSAEAIAQLAAVVREADWEHSELRVRDVALGTGLSPANLRTSQGPGSRGHLPGMRDSG